MFLKKIKHSVMCLAIAMCPTQILANDIKHELGVTTLSGTPEKIVVLEFSFLDALASAGIAPVGIADDNKRHAVIEEYTRVIGDDWVSVGTRKTPSLEIISSLAPDLIIADKTRHSSAYNAMSQIAPVIVLDSLGGDYHSAIEQMAVIGQALGKEADIAARVAAHKQRMAKFATQIRKISVGKSAQFGITNANGLWAHSPISYIGSVLAMFGFDSGMALTEGGVYESKYVKTSLEQLSVVNPDILILGKYTDPAFTDGWTEDTIYKDITAVKNGDIYEVDAHIWGRLRGMLAAERTAADIIEIMKKVGD